MRILSRYVRDEFLLTFLVTLLVVTFVMCVMVFLRVSDFLAMGGSLPLILTIFLAGMPSALGFSIPMSVITSTLLTFGRLSANGEITAMKSSGISMWQIVRQPLLFSFLTAAICFYLNADVIPASCDARERALRMLGMKNPIQLLDEGRVIRDFPGFTFYIGSKKDQQLFDVLIYQWRTNGPPRSIRARTATVQVSPDKKQLVVVLHDVRIDPFSDDRPGAGYAKDYPLVIDVARLRPDASPVKKRSELTLGELLDRIANIPAVFPELGSAHLAEQRIKLLVELHKRIVLAFSCLAFAMVGIPLGTKSHRKESSIGIGISLLLVFVFYLFIIFAEHFVAYPGYHPYLIAWVPVVFSLGLGLYLIHRCD